jgi:hypothetical protein
MRAKTRKTRELSFRVTRQKSCVLTLLGTREQSAIFLEAEVDVDEVSTSQELHDHSRGDDGTDTELHQRPPIGGQDDTHPIERVGGIRGHDTIQRHLRADQEDEEGDGCP